jgi:hypothetical protein
MKGGALHNISVRYCDAKDVENSQYMYDVRRMNFDY